ARFLVLTAPDAVRLNRLLRRGDAFDRAAPSGTASAGDSAFDLPGAEGILAPSDIERLRADVAAGHLTADDVRGKFAIIAAERRNYDPDRTVAALLAHAPERTAVVDTTVCGPAEVGAALARLLAGSHAQAAA
ncbi:MAG TPA: hypothetical protein VGE72_12330, partial [Azospirillum sp.]